MTENNTSKTTDRSILEVCHFVMGFIGLFTGLTGVVISSICIAGFGAALLIWALLFFAVNSKWDSN